MSLALESQTAADSPLDSGPFFHGTKAKLHPGELLEPRHASNYGERKTANFVYLTATLDAAVWGAELARGEGKGRIYQVEPTGALENDPNLTDRKFPGNPTRSYRSRYPLRVIREVEGWAGHPPDVLQAMMDHLAELERMGIEAIND
ncbi:MAG: NAD(+)--rifampin ADP-ribosyltransferase [Clostridiaceae bacterium]